MCIYYLQWLHRKANPIHVLFYIVIGNLSPVSFKQNTCPNGQVSQLLLQLSLDQIVLCRQNHGLRTGLNAQFLKNIVHVKFERGLADGQSLRALLVGQSLCQKHQYLQLEVG